MAQRTQSPGGRNTKLDRCQQNGRRGPNAALCREGPAAWGMDVVSSVKAEMKPAYMAATETVWYREVTCRQRQLETQHKVLTITQTDLCPGCGVLKAPV
jgi:hypothetical protein